MSLGWGPNMHEHRRRVRELAVRDVLVIGLSPLAVSMTWNVPVATIEQWVEDAQADAAAEG